MTSRLAVETDPRWQPPRRCRPEGWSCCWASSTCSTTGTRFGSRPNVERLVALIAIHATPQPRARVASTLAMDITEARAGARLRAALWRIERVAPGWVVRDENRLALAPDVRVDLPHATAHARRIVDEGDRLSVEDERFEDLTCDLLPHWEEEWLIFERERLRQLRVHALESLSHLLTRRRRHARAIDAGMAAVATEPLRESTSAP